MKTLLRDFRICHDGARIRRPLRTALDFVNRETVRLAAVHITNCTIVSAVTIASGCQDQKRR